MVAVPHIAAMANGQQIRRIVVPFVVIDVVNNKRALMAFLRHATPATMMAISLPDGGSKWAGEARTIVFRHAAHPRRIVRPRKITAMNGGDHIGQPRARTIGDRSLDRFRACIDAAVARKTRHGSLFDLFSRKRRTLACRPVTAPDVHLVPDCKTVPAGVMPVRIPGWAHLLRDRGNQRSAATGALNLWRGRDLRVSALSVPSLSFRLSQHAQSDSSYRTCLGAMGLWRTGWRVATPVDPAVKPASGRKEV